MRLTRIDLHGFKSFFHRTSLDLPAGISAVVGPNGCGKSNIADAIRWVMGEQSAHKLRGRGMEDVIFSGSAKNRSLGLAEVSLTLERTNGAFPSPFHHYDELTVTRRLYRSGESEYLINKLPCRLKDITHLFMDTGLGNRGYAIIEQGSIGRIVDSGPEERRAWIEEAAGVVKFKAQRLAANRKMEQTTHNLERVSDILAEVERQSASLKRQAQKARRHRALTGEIQALDLALAAAQRAELINILEKREGADRDLADRREELLVSEAADSARISAMRLSLSEDEQALAERREGRSKLRTRIMSLEQERQHLEEKVADLGLRREQDQAGQKEESKRLAEVERELEQLSGRAKGLETGLEADLTKEEEARTKLEQARQKVEQLTRNVSGTKDRLIDLVSRRAGANNAMITAKERLGSVQSRLDHLAQQADQAKADQDTLTKQLNDSEGALETARARLEELRADQEFAAEARAVAQEEVNAAKAELEAAGQEVRKVESRLEGLESLATSLEGVGEGARRLLNDKGLEDEAGQRLFHGLLAEAVMAAPDLEPALEAVLAGGAEFLMAASAKAVEPALELLGREKSGRAGIMALDLLAPETEDGPAPEGAQFLRQKIEFSGPGAELARALIGQTILAPDLPSALKIWQADGRKRPVVTLAGELIAPPGVVSGGRAAKPQASILARQRVIRELSDQLDLLREKEGRRLEQLEMAEENLAVQTEEVRALEERIREAEEEGREAEKELSQWTIRLEEISRLDEVLGAEAQAIEEDRRLQEKILQEQTEVMARVEAEQEAMDQDLNQAESKVQEAASEAARRQEELTDLRIVISRMKQQREQMNQEASRLEQDRRRTDARIEALKAAVANSEKSIQTCLNRSARGEEELKHLTLEAGQEDQNLDRIAAGLAQRKEDAAQAESKLRTLQAELRAVDEKARQAGLALSETRMELKHLLDDIRERYEIDLGAEHSRYLDPELKPQAAGEELADLKRKLANLGPVNLTAVEEYQALEDRREFLENQVADLNSSMDDLKKAIRKINQTSIERFMETFREVAQRMRELAPILFGEGALAELHLVEPDNPLESGVDIKIQPAGKKLVNMGLLSGGEKALAAVTLLFAIFLHKPSPFCLLDEVDAPLDEHNVDRFNSLVREIGKHSQILMITHNRRTMEVVDNLYGVTMPEPGISRLVSVRLDTEANKIDELVQEAP